MLDHEDARQIALEAVDWDEGGRGHNWRNHIGSHTKGIWDSFTTEQKIALILDADFEAGNGNWE